MLTVGCTPSVREARIAGPRRLAVVLCGAARDCDVGFVSGIRVCCSHALGAAGREAFGCVNGVPVAVVDGGVLARDKRWQSAGEADQGEEGCDVHVDDLGAG